MFYILLNSSWKQSSDWFSSSRSTPTPIQQPPAAPFFEPIEFDNFTKSLSDFSPILACTANTSEEYTAPILSLESLLVHPSQLEDKSAYDSHSHDNDSSTLAHPKSAKRSRTRKTNLHSTDKTFTPIVEPYSCKHCSTKFDTIKEIGIHWFTAHPKKMEFEDERYGFRCPHPHCDHTTTKKDVIIAHIQNRHAELCEAKCSICNHAFFTENRFERHTRFLEVPDDYISHRSGDLKKHLEKKPHRQSIRKRIQANSFFLCICFLRIIAL